MPEPPPDDLRLNAARLAESLRADENAVDPVDAGSTGLALLDLLDDAEEAAEPHEVQRGVDLIDFALRHLPGHPCAHLWRFRSAGALTYLAEHTGSEELLASALSNLALVAADASAPADLAEWAAVDTAELTKVRLATGDFTAEEAGRLLDALAGHAAVVHDREELLSFQRELALAHRWAYPHTLDLGHLEHAATGLTAVLAELPEGDTSRPEAWEALALVQEERHRLTGELPLLDAAITAASALRDLVAEMPGVHQARTLLAGLLCVRYLERDTTDDADEALREYDAVLAVEELDPDHATNHGVLKCLRANDRDDADGLLAGVRALTEVADTAAGRSAWVLSMLADAHASLTRLVGAEHLWPVLDWAGAALAVAGEEHDGTVQLRITRFEAAEAAAEQFGVHTVLARYDVRDWLADAERAVLDAPPDIDQRLRAQLTIRLLLLRTRWMAELTRPDDDLGVELRDLCDLADTVRKNMPDAENNALAGLVAYLSSINRAYVAGGSADPLELALMTPFYDLFRTTRPDSEADAVGAEMIALTRALSERLRAGQDFRALTSDYIALAWRVDALAPGAERDRLQHSVRLLSMGFGTPRSTAPEVPAEVLNPVSDFDSLFGKAAELRSAVMAGDVDRALALQQVVEQFAADSPKGSPQELLVGIASGVARATMVKLLPTQPEARDEEMASAEAEWSRSGHPEAALGLARRLRSRGLPGDRERSRELGLTAAHSNGEQVTVWCLADEDDDGLVRVLETRRAMALDIVPRGFGTAEVQSALRATGTDALIYLLPRNDLHVGVGVVVPADRPVRVTPLPLLRVERISRFRRALETFQADARTAPRRQVWRDEVTALCAWAWEVAGPVFEPWQDARLALVPVGELGRVPWEAAHRDVDGRRRFLLQDNEITLVPAAAVLSTHVGGTAVPPRAVFVGNPGRDAAAAAVTAESMRDESRCGGVFLGGHGGPPRPWRQSPDGAGTPEEVLAAMAHGLDVLHLGCRATSELDDPGRSALTLHGGDLVPPPADVGLVTLPDHVLRGDVHDDAKTLPARFLAGGARHVLAARWPTSGDLVRRVHHLLASADGSTPGAALREVQRELLERSAIDEWAAIAHHGG
ncbi:hypothetical protein GCM10011609_27710 [Lentzea pudingi]|uniref:CHAT domain-containing protein n=2 Tax=Lentzea pudingi TaxID=1789439 RepID=A0ABQ2HR92_9PSEU|nr:hypothetical protein GCM10011609_27710 [Lentzea pudingi]